MALNFPTNPTTGQSHDATNGIRYIFDGVKWITQGSNASGLKDIIKLDSITSQFNGTLTTFDLKTSGTTVKPFNAETLTISLGGVIQEPQTAYTVDTNAGTITFDSAPPTGMAFYGILNSRAPLSTGSLSDGSVTNAKVNANAAIDGSKLQAASGSNAGSLSASDFTKLAGIDIGAKDDQTASEIVALVADQTIAPSEINIGDNEKIQLGNSQDLKIFHDGSQSIILDNGTGQLRISGENTIALTNAAGTENYARFLKDGAVELYHDNVKKVETSANGLDLPDNSKLQLGTSQDLKIYHDGTHSFIQKGDGTGNLYVDANGIILRGTNAETLASFTENGAVELYFDNGLTAKTISSGFSVTGSLGVNTDSPSTPIHIVSSGARGITVERSSTANASIEFKNSSDSMFCGLTSNGTGFAIDDDDNLASGPMLFVKASDGNVGIANDSPTEKLDVTGNVKLSGNIEPNADNASALGSASKRFTTLHSAALNTGDINMSNLNDSANEVDGSKGSWSIQEGADDLFIINRVSGKKYKFNLTEIS